MKVISRWFPFQPVITQRCEVTFIPWRVIFDFLCSKIMDTRFTGRMPSRWGRPRGFSFAKTNCSQIIGPHDDGISKAIKLYNHQGAPTNQLDIFSSELLVDMTKQLQTEYFEYLRSLLTNRCAGGWNFLCSFANRLSESLILTQAINL